MLAQPGTGQSAIEVVAVEDAAGEGRYVILCDHASNAIPGAYQDLGLGAAERQAHIAWDPGALPVARGVAAALHAPLVRATLSRLIIDCNRAPDAGDLIPSISETTPIPGNAELPDAERRRRIDAIHRPYHARIEQLLAKRTAAGLESALVAVHSFTATYRGVRRPWDIGVLFDRDRRLADPLIAAFRGEGLQVGVNQPYSPADGVYYTLQRHGESGGHASVMIEIRNDLIATPEAQGAWAERLARALQRAQPDG